MKERDVALTSLVHELISFNILFLTPPSDNIHPDAHSGNTAEEIRRNPFTTRWR